MLRGKAVVTMLSTRLVQNCPTLVSTLGLKCTLEDIWGFFGGKGGMIRKMKAGDPYMRRLPHEMAFVSYVTPSPSSNVKSWSSYSI